MRFALYSFLDDSVSILVLVLRRLSEPDGFTG
jgi:hypothetical protein